MKNLISESALFLGRKTYWAQSKISLKEEILECLKYRINCLNEGYTEEELYSKLEEDFGIIREKYQISDSQFEVIVEQSLNEFWGALKPLIPALRSGGKRIIDFLRKRFGKVKPPETPKQTPKLPKGRPPAGETPETPKAPEKAETPKRPERSEIPKPPSAKPPIIPLPVLIPTPESKPKTPDDSAGMPKSEPKKEIDTSSYEKTVRDMLAARNKHTGIDSDIDSTINKLKKDNRPDTWKNFIRQQGDENIALGVGR